MPRVLGIDPGTLSIDLCVLEEGRPTEGRRLPTADLADDPGALLRELRALGSFDLVAAPSGYGLPLLRGEDVDERLLRLAFLAAPGAEAGILGLRRAVAALREGGQPLVFVPGVIHLPTVPAHRKVNRIDMGTADKVCSAAMAIAGQAQRLAVDPFATSLVLVELGGAFTAVLAVEGGAIVDGVGGTSGPLGYLAAGALDGEVVALAGVIPRDALFTGGAAWVAGNPALAPEQWQADACAGAPAAIETPARLAWLAYVEGVTKAVAAQLASVVSAREIVLAGRLARLPALIEELACRLRAVAPGADVRSAGAWTGPGGAALPVKEAAVGAAMLADGLCGGVHARLVGSLRLREAAGTVLDHVALPVARAGADRFLEVIR